MRKAVNGNYGIREMLVKEELEWDGECGVSEAAAQAGLYVKHEVRRELVLGPELLQPQDIAYKIRHKPEPIKAEKEAVKNEQTSHEPRLDARCIAQLLTTCYVRLHRIPEICTTKQKVFKKTNSLSVTTNGQELDKSPTHTKEDLCESNDDTTVQSKRDPQTIPETSVHSQKIDVTRRVVTKNRNRNRRYQRLKKTYPCETCGEKFTAKKKLKAHAGKHRVKKTKPRKVDEGKYKCEACGRRFLDKRKLLFHMLVHMGLRPYTCTTCNKRFSCSSRLEIHEQSHTGEKKYICDICDKRFTRKYALTRHILVHMGAKYTCEICNKQFSSSSYLVQHQRLHSGVKTYTCEICNAQFLWISSFVQHKRIHTGVKDICEICGKSFATTRGLKKHYLIHKGVKPYPCEFCKKKFRTKPCLRGHVERVHTNRPSGIGVEQPSEGTNSTSLKEIHPEITPDTFEIREKPAISNEAQPRDTETETTLNSCELKENHTNKSQPSLETNLVDEEKTLDLCGSKEDLTANRSEAQPPIETPLVNMEKSLHLCESIENHSGNTNESKPSQDTSIVLKNKTPSLCQSKEVQPVNRSEIQAPLDILAHTEKISNLFVFNENDSGNKGEGQITQETPLVRTKNTLDFCESRDNKPGNISEIQLSLENTVRSEINFDVQTETSPTCHEIIDFISSLATPNSTKETNIKIEFDDENTEIESKPYSCDTCGKRYGEKKHLIPHCRAHMDNFTCVVCNKTYTYGIYLERHLMTHLVKPKYICNVCDMELCSQHSLERHERIHTITEKRHRCNICKKKFREIYDLRKHLKTHTGLKPFSCDICKKQFGTQGNLTRHILIHGATKPFSCDICEKRFARRAYVLEHKQIHTVREKLYSCEICNRQFLHKSTYITHKKLHTGPREKTLSCEICDAKFAEARYLAKHNRIHTGVRPFSCDLCGKRFYTKSHLDRHTKSQKRPCVD